MKLSWRTEWLQWVLLGGMFLLAALTWGSAPDRIPVHWGLTGRPDRFGGRFEGILFLPLFSVAIYGLLLLAPRIDPGRANYPSFAGSYTVVRTAVIALMAAIYGVTQLSIRDGRVNTTTGLALALGVLFLVLGNVMGKLRPNWFVGIRTPWTLSSKLAWTKTHRLGGRLFVLIGLEMLLAGMTGRPWAFVAGMAALVGGSMGLAVYSFFIWRKDPDKTPPAGTLPA